MTDSPLPTLMLSAFFLGGLVLFFVRLALWGYPPSEERGFFRRYFFWLMGPLFAAIRVAGLPASALTALAGLLGMGSGAAVATGRFGLGGTLFLISGVLDTLDGRLARTEQHVSKAGAALDSVLDRYVDGALIVGLAWYYRESWVLGPTLFAFIGVSLVPYIRARGEGLGVSLKSGMGQRLGRTLVLGIGVVMSPLFDPTPRHWPAMVGVCLVAVISNVTAIARLRALLIALADDSLRSAYVSLNGIAAVLATVIDFTCVVMLVEWVGLAPATATVFGACGGAAVNYTFNRVLTYRSRAWVPPELGRYAFVSGTSALLNSGGVALLQTFESIHYQPVWWGVRMLVWALWNLPMQRRYVFGGQDSVAE